MKAIWWVMDAKIKEKRKKRREWKIPECFTGFTVNTVCESVSIMSQCVCVCVCACLSVCCTAFLTVGLKVLKASLKVPDLGP